MHYESQSAIAGINCKFNRVIQGAGATRGNWNTVEQVHGSQSSPVVTNSGIDTNLQGLLPIRRKFPNHPNNSTRQHRADQQWWRDHSTESALVYFGTTMLKKSIPIISLALLFRVDATSFPYKAMPALLPHAIGATTQEDLEAQLKILMSALSSCVSASLAAIISMALEGNGHSAKEV